MPGFWRTLCAGRKKKYQADPEVVVEQVQCTKSHELRTFKKMALSDDDDVKIMLNGSQLWKIKPGWQQQRLYQLESDGMTIWYQSRAKKARSKQIFSILHIDSVREGHQSEGLRKHGRRFPESCCFSISFMGRRKNLDLAASSEQEAQSWIHGLQKLGQRAIAMSQREKLVHWIRDYLHQADRDGDEKMSFQEVKDMLRMINIDMNDIYAYTLFKKCDRSNTDRLEDHEIEEFCTQLMYRPELEEIFHEYSGEDRVLSAEELQEFLQHQGEEATLERAREIIHKYELNEKAKQHDLMMQEGFMMYLLSAEGDIFNQKHRKVYEDMTQPLSHYFISSSHNTYLTNHQLVGSSSTESYIRAFMDGCRCVELDCWEGTNGEPVIYHGHTFTSKILFKDVIATIKHYAFKALRGKILVKGKKLSERRLAEDEEGRARMETAQELSDLVIYCQSVEYRDQPGSVCEMSSFSEDKVRKLMKESGNTLVRYNTRQLSRIYPDALRAGSSNFSPQEMWNAGCQLVALNLQTPGYKMDLNRGRFQDNGCCGYVLKPDFLRREDTCFNPEDLSSSMKILNIKIISAQQLPKLNQENPNSIVDPFVRVEIHSLGRRREQETTYILNNGFNPTWNETLRLEVLCPALALVRFVVEDYDKTSSNDFVGQYTLPFPSLKQGYRHVHLLSNDGASLTPATLFVHLHIEDPGQSRPDSCPSG
ncbi:PREDICTED: 1-phosphatidylinositol 4,5-bisphosphate phosphodiesterase delta-3 isoform X2 [Nanorana parkeri]|uniref:1-phosphatidylinositol 4,5-bisphosphate phosphodiesterase delta-3 isoform X2 n=1 Tax=Nanorana parkeri TaxID=125878 RepID=UPI00085495B1|nr:PREDICTED: 1-phosphatidylinositol 4,5-bisphosphate phosphodiesterase delta-3 isoform X2 [Nanorana parkeri]